MSRQVFSRGLYTLNFASIAALLLSLAATLPAQQVGFIEHPIPNISHEITAGPDGAL